jgi:hypothetical protein
MRKARWYWLLLIPVASLVIAHFDRAATISPGNWREASRDPVGLAPDPAMTRDAIVQVYAARAVRWRGYFGVHTWIAVKPTDAEQYKVYEVTRWNQRRNGSMVAVSERVPDERWYGNAPQLIVDVRGPRVDDLIDRIEAAVRDYPYDADYRVWPGPNSNTFTAYVLRQVPELRAELPPTAVGKDYLGARLVSGSPSGTGFQLSLLGLMGVMAGVEEGIELNMLGMTYGIDPLDLAIKLPFAGRFGLISNAAAQGAEPAGSAVQSRSRQFTFSWPFIEDGGMRPRGGSTQGTAVTLRTEPTKEWQRLNEPGLSAFERDRRAILAMAGRFRTSFDFIEAVGFTPDFEADRPYQSWATEVVDVIEDSGETIVLQHVIVMEYIDDDGNVQGPVVQKHWRQEWVYEDRSIHAYSGHDSWMQQTFSANDVRGRWSQAVFQVDDSPRYEALGDWVHMGNYSAWMSDETWRPLPRRESSVRDDYDVLIGTNRHTITPTGWVHEENNLKAVLDGDGSLAEGQAILARELGINRYEAIENFDFSARDEYWRATADFWSDVRAEWRRIYAEHPRIEIAVPDGEAPLFLPMFDYAAELEAGRSYDAESGQRFIRDTLAHYLNF